MKKPTKEVIHYMLKIVDKRGYGKPVEQGAGYFDTSEGIEAAASHFKENSPYLQPNSDWDHPDVQIYIVTNPVVVKDFGKTISII